ncbi:MAG: sugar ABC transporter substrate-binding protein [Symploca sp. SIO2E6]|nr:sugar ABC transporter substrate-binding protein [Symploca sp. SIO2E6]
MKNNLLITLIAPFYISICLVSCKSVTNKSSVVDNKTPSSSDIDPNKAKDYSIVEQSNIDLETEIVATKPWKITFVTKAPHYEKLSEHDYWPVAWQGIEKAGKDFGVNVELAYIPEPCDYEFQCIEAQIKLISEYLNSKTTDAMIIAPIDANRLVTVTEKIIDQGIPIIAFDAAINTNKILSLVTFHNFQAGKLMGEWLVEKLDNNSNVFILEGVTNQSSSISRRNGFLAGLQQGNINVIDTQSALWNTDMAEKITTQWLEEFSDIDAIICANDLMALGALRAIKKAKRNDIIITGYDAINQVVQAIAKGDIAATIDQSPDLQARIAVQMMVRHLETGESLPPIIFMPEIKLVSEENVQRPLQ